MRERQGERYTFLLYEQFASRHRLLLAATCIPEWRCRLQWLLVYVCRGTTFKSIWYLSWIEILVLRHFERRLIAKRGRLNDPEKK